MDDSRNMLHESTHVFHKLHECFWCPRQHDGLACVAILHKYVLLCTSRPVSRVERWEITKRRGHSCKATLNASVPLEQMPRPKQLYGCFGSAQVNGNVGQLPTSEWWTAAQQGGRDLSRPSRTVINSRFVLELQTG